MQNKQEIRGTEFVTDRIDPLAVPIDNGPDILSGDEYIYQLTLPFIFKVRTKLYTYSERTKQMEPILRAKVKFFFQK